MDIHQCVGNAIRGSRTRLAMSQQELANRAGLHRTFISNLERGTCNISLTNLCKVANVLEVAIRDLFAYEYSSGDTKTMVRNLPPPVSSLVAHNGKSDHASAHNFARVS